jgi:hypothetical protein
MSVFDKIGQSFSEKDYFSTTNNVVTPKIPITQSYGPRISTTTEDVYEKKYGNPLEQKLMPMKDLNPSMRDLTKSIANHSDPFQTLSPQHPDRYKNSGSAGTLQDISQKRTTVLTPLSAAHSVELTKQGLKSEMGSRFVFLGIGILALYALSQNM